MYVPDAYDQFVQHEAEQQKELEKLPVCEYCVKPVQDDHYYDFGDGVICPVCMESYFRKDVADYVG